MITKIAVKKCNYVGWDDIGYNFLVGEDGQGYEGRGWEYVGAHAGEQCNFITLGISLIGEFEDNRPNQAIMDAVLDIIDCGIQEVSSHPFHK